MRKKQFYIVVEDTVITLRRKVIAAKSLAEAKLLAYEEEWTPERGWEE